MKLAGFVLRNHSSTGSGYTKEPMAPPILATALRSPLPRSRRLPPRLIERFVAGCTLADVDLRSAGFGKTTLVSVMASCQWQPAAWLSLDEEG
jgi:ATP/maltotriose-dependent transcriptional regulator MalT